MRQMRQIFTTNPWLGPKEGGRRLEAKRNVRDWRNQKLVFFIGENYQKCVFFSEKMSKSVVLLDEMSKNVVLSEED